MSIENESVVDGMGLDHATGDVVLTISDHLDWADSRAHLQMLERKVNAYLGFFESGQLLERMPEAAGRKLKIDIYHQFAPPPDVANILDGFGVQLGSHGIAFWYGELPPGN